MTALRRSTSELDTFLDDVRAAPADAGEVQLIVTRPGAGEREAHDTSELDALIGLVGDNWFTRGSSKTPDGLADPDAQLTIMSTRAASAVAGGRAHWALAGDQIYADLDLSHANLPAGTRLQVGTAVVEVTPKLHPGCAKFTRRFGPDAFAWVNTDGGRDLRLRGMYVRVLEPGQVTLGDLITKL